MTTTSPSPGPAAAPGGLRLGPMVHEDHHELAWVTRGTVQVTIGSRTWGLDERVALWIPAGTPHTVDIAAGAFIVPWFLPTELATPPLAHPSLVAVHDEVRPRLQHATQLWLTRSHPDPSEVRSIMALLRPPGPEPDVHLPSSAAALQVATSLISDPADPRTLGEWATTTFVSPRTLQRAFLDEAGLGFTDWRARVRVRAAGPLLRSGRPVGAVANAVGYASAGGFITAFRRVHGRTPRELYRAA